MNQLSKIGLGRFRHVKETVQSEKALAPEKYTGPYDDSPIPRLTFHSAIMALLVSMGGFGEQTFASLSWDLPF